MDGTYVNDFLSGNINSPINPDRDCNPVSVQMIRLTIMSEHNRLIGRD